MKGCHDCAVADEIANGVYENAAWDETPCASCKVADRTGFSMAYDDDREPAGQDAGEDTSGQLVPVGVLAGFVEGFLKLPPELRDVVAMRYAGMKYARIAEIQGVSMACVEKRHRQAMKLWPELRELFPVKASKQLRRKPHRQKIPAFGNKQGVTGRNCGKTVRKQGASASRIRRGRRLQ